MCLPARISPFTSSSAWAVRDAARHYERLARCADEVAGTQLNGQLSLEDREHLLAVLVRMPDEPVLELEGLDLIVIQAHHQLGRPERGDETVLAIDAHTSSVTIPACEVRCAANESRGAYGLR